MQHHFDVEHAEKYGILEAVIINHMAYWIAKNEANETHYYDGHYWTYNSIKAFETLFPYVTGKQIRKALEHLVEEGILVKGNYNRSAYDHTLWYRFSEKGKSIFPTGQIEFPSGANRIYTEGKPIPDNNTDNNTDNKENSKEKVDYESIREAYNTICKSFPKCVVLSEARKRAIKARLNTYTVEDFTKLFQMAEASSFLKGNNDRNWTATLDWMIKDTNMAKILDGNYADKEKKMTGKFYNIIEHEHTAESDKELEYKLLEASRRRSKEKWKAEE